MKCIVKSILVMIANIIPCLTAIAQDKFTEGKQAVSDRVFETRFSEVDVNRMTVNSQLPEYKNGYSLQRVRLNH